MPLLEKHLYLKKSKLPSAGLGLFTRIDIPKGKLIAEYKDTNVGIIEFTSKNSLKIHKKAIQNSSKFEFDCMFKLLHKKEYLNLVKRNFGFIPDVPNTKIFRVCYDLLESIDILDFQKQVLTTLKKRNIDCPELLKSNDTPTELKHICYTLNFNSNEYDELFNLAIYAI